MLQKEFKQLKALEEEVHKTSQLMDFYIKSVTGNITFVVSQAGRDTLDPKEQKDNFTFFKEDINKINQRHENTNT
jgi:hypothetical protein